MEISRYASRLASDSRVLPSGRPQPSASPGQLAADQASQRSDSSNFVPLESPGLLPEEPDDAKLTGGTRSLSRRLLALNIPGLAAVQASRKSSVGGGTSPKPRTRKVAIAKSLPAPQDA